MAGGAALLRYQPHYNQRGTQAPTHRPGDRTEVLGGVAGVAREGAAVPSAWLQRAAEMPKQSSLDGSTRQKSFRLVSVRFVMSVPSPCTPASSPLTKPVFVLGFCFFFLLFLLIS